MMHQLNAILVLPEIFLAVTAMGFLMAGVFQGNRSTDVLSWSAIVSCLICGLLILKTDWSLQYALNDMLVIDGFAQTVKLLILFGTVVSLVLCVNYLYQERIARFEYPVLILFAAIGMMFMVSANNFLSLYMALELQSLSLYVLAAFHRNSLKSGEAATKYFILGALSSGMLLFGISLIYGFMGTVDFVIINETLQTIPSLHPGFIVGMVFVIAALVFKISAAPFHMWTPDVYEGSPTSVTAFFAIVPKVAALALIMRLLFGPFDGAEDQWQQIIYFVSIASLLVGSFAAIAQNNIKRLLAYSSVGNMGYALIGIAAASEYGIASVLTFIFIYMVMTAGLFAIILNMRRNELSVERIEDLAGLSKNNPVIAYAMALLMFSMSGIPPLAGFFGKLFIFQAAIQSELYLLAILGVLASVVAAYYYLRIIKVMFFDPPADAFDKGMCFEHRIILLLSVLTVLAFILAPDLVFSKSLLAAGSLF